MSANLPAERVIPGVGFQKVHVIRDGEPLALITHYGTEEQARAKAEMQLTHDTDDRWPLLRAIVLGDLVPGTREAAIEHLLTCETCHDEDTEEAGFDELTYLDLADSIHTAHEYAKRNG